MKRVKVSKKVEKVVEEKMEVEEAEAEASDAEDEDEDAADAADETIAEADESMAVDPEDASDAESDISLTHEALKKKQKPKKLPNYVPAGESKEERDRRTVFVGNIDIAVTKNKVSQRVEGQYRCNDFVG